MLAGLQSVPKALHEAAALDGANAWQRLTRVTIPTLRPTLLFAGDVEVEEAAEYLYQNGIPAYAYSTELPVEVLGAKYKWARGAGLL